MSTGPNYVLQRHHPGMPGVSAHLSVPVLAVVEHVPAELAARLAHRHLVAGAQAARDQAHDVVLAIHELTVRRLQDGERHTDSERGK